MEITKEYLQNLVQNHTLRHIARKVLHIRDEKLTRLLDEYRIEKIPKYKRRTYPVIKDNVKEFILGSLLGDGSVVKKGPQHRLSYSHGMKQKEYISHKKEVLGELSLSKIQKVKTKGHNINCYIKNEWQEHYISEYNGFVLHSKVHPHFTELRNKLYVKKKKVINEWWLNQLTNRSLAYWFMDDGCANYTDNSYVIMMSTYCYTYDEHLLLKDFLNNKFKIDIILQKVKNRGYGYTTRLNVENSKKLRDLMQPYIIPSMLYKIDKQAWLNKKQIEAAT